MATVPLENTHQDTDKAAIAFKDLKILGWQQYDLVVRVLEFTSFVLKYHRTQTS